MHANLQKPEEEKKLAGNVKKTSVNHERRGRSIQRKLGPPTGAASVPRFVSSPEEKKLRTLQTQ